MQLSACMCAVMAVLLAACQGNDTTVSSSNGALADVLPATLDAFEMQWPSRGSAEVDRRIAGALETLGGGRVSEAEVGRARATASSGGDQWFRLANPLQRYTAVYHPDVDEIRVMNRDLLAERWVGESITEDEAAAVFRAAIGDLDARGILVLSDYDLSATRTGHRRAGRGTRDGALQEETVTEYRFTALRSVSGIPVANAGVIVGIHPSGAISSLRFGGVTVTSSRTDAGETPVAPGWSFPRATALTSVRAAFASFAGPDALIEEEGLMYRMKRGERRAVIEPTYNFRFTRASPSRQHTVGFSLRVDDGAPIVFSPVPSDPTGDETVIR